MHMNNRMRKNIHIGGKSITDADLFCVEVDPLDRIAYFD